MLLDERIEAAMKARRQEYSYVFPLQVFTCTWNVGNYNPDSPGLYTDILKWLFSESLNCELNLGSNSTTPEARAELNATGAGSDPKHSHIQNIETANDPKVQAKLCNADVIVVTLQEIVNLDNPIYYIGGNYGSFSSNKYCNEWGTLFLTAINEHHQSGMFPLLCSNHFSFNFMLDFL